MAINLNHPTNTIDGTSVLNVNSGDGENIELNPDSGLVNVNGNINIAGNFTVQGTTTTINSATSTIVDPIILLGTDEDGNPASTVDSKDRGVAFYYNDGAGNKTGFLGYDRGTGYFRFVPDATISGEIVSGSDGTIKIDTLESTTINTVDLNVSNDTAITGDLTVGGHVIAPTTEIGDLNFSTNIISSDSTGDIVLDPGSNDIDVTNSTIKNLLDPTNLQDAATKNYVDTSISSDVNLEIAADTGTGTINLDTETLTINGTIYQIETNITGNVITITLPTNMTVPGSLNVTTDLVVTGTTTLNDPLTVNDTASITGNTDIGGELQVTGATTLNDPLTVNDTASITGNTDIGGTLDVTLTSNFQGDVTVQTNLHVLGNTDIDGDLNVDGNITLGGNITIGDQTLDTVTVVADFTSNLIPDVDSTYDIGETLKRWRTLYADNIDVNDLLINDTLTVTGDTTIGGTLQVTGATTLNDPLTVNDTANITGNTDIGGELQVTGATTLNDPLTVNDTVDITGNLTVPTSDIGDLNFAGNTISSDVTGDIVIDPDIYDIDVSNSIIKNLLDPNNLQDAATKNYVDNAINSNTNLAIAADVGLGSINLATETFTVNGTVNEIETDLTDNTITVSLPISMTVPGSLNVTTNLVVTGTTTLNDPLTVNDTANITGNTDIGGALQVTGATTLNSNLSVDGDTSLTGTLGVSGATSIANTLGVLDAVSFDSSLDVYGSTTLHSTLAVTGATTLNDPLTVNDTASITGNTDIGGALQVTGATTLNSTLSVTNNATFSSDVTVTGNLNVMGTLTSINTADTTIKDNFITLNDGETNAGVTAGYSGIEIDRGSEPNALLWWNEGNDFWEVGVGEGYANLAANNLYLAGSAIIEGSITSTSLTASNLTETRVVLAGVGGQLTDSSQLTFTGTGMYLRNNLYINEGNNIIASGNIDVVGEVTAANVTVTTLDEDRIPFADVNGRLVDSPSLTFDVVTALLSVPNISASNQIYAVTIKDEHLTPGRITFAGSGKELVDSELLTFDATSGALTVDGLTFDNTTISAVADDIILDPGIYNIDVTNSRITNVANPIDPQDVTTKSWVETTIENNSNLAIAGTFGSGTVNLATETLTVAGTSNQITTIAAGQAITVSLPNAVVMPGSLAVTTTLDVTAHTNLSTLTGSGSATLDSLSVTNDLSVGGNTSVTGDTIIYGNLTVQGTTTSVQSVDTTISDNIITLNDGELGPGVSAGYSGILVDRGTEPDTVFQWNELLDRWEIKEGSNLTNFAALEADIGDVNISGNTITTTEPNGDLIINSNGTGQVIVNGEPVVTGLDSIVYAIVFGG